MKLSDLQTGESAIILKVLGHGGFRKRILEMGFVAGQKVEVLLNAPLKDPVKYSIMKAQASMSDKNGTSSSIYPKTIWKLLLQPLP